MNSNTQPQLATIDQIVTQLTTPKPPGPTFYGDVPRTELIEMIRKQKKDSGYNPRLLVFGKFTCPQCQYRNTVLVPLPEKGKCLHCAAETPLTSGGFSAMIIPPQANPEEIITRVSEKLKTPITAIHLIEDLQDQQASFAHRMEISIETRRLFQKNFNGGDHWIIYGLSPAAKAAVAVLSKILEKMKVKSTKLETEVVFLDYPKGSRLYILMVAKQDLPSTILATKFLVPWRITAEQLDEGQDIIALVSTSDDPEEHQRVMGGMQQIAEDTTLETIT